MEFITDREALRQHYRTPGDGAVRKELRRLDHHAKGFLARSPFVLIGSSDDKGNADVTPKGDKPGFVAILDDATIAIPDRPGNNRLDTLENVLVNPAVGLLFLIPGMNETLRINGDARLTADPVLRERLAAEGKPPVTVMVVAIKAVYMHCAKAFMRSELWAPGTWPDQLALADNAETLDRSLDESYRKSMW